MKKKAQWRLFESAVAAFLAKLDPRAVVHHDYKQPDQHHGGTRQRDVWIETRALGHLPVSILISCKRYGRSLHSGDIERFDGELRSSGARVGAIYSYAGFGTRALAKAKALGISCCSLYEGQAGKQPVFPFVICSAWLARASVACGRPSLDQSRSAADDQAAIASLVAAFFEALQEEVARSNAALRVPSPFQTRPALVKGLQCAVTGTWQHYRSRANAVDVNGSYELTSNHFVGSIASPPIDLYSTTLGPGWEEVGHEAPPVPTLFNLFLAPNVTMEGLTSAISRCVDDATSN